MDKAGRRTLTLAGLGGMCLCAVAMTVGLKFQVHLSSEDLGVGAIVLFPLVWLRRTTV